MATKQLHSNCDTFSSHLYLAKPIWEKGVHFSSGFLTFYKSEVTPMNGNELVPCRQQQ